MSETAEWLPSQWAHKYGPSLDAGGPASRVDSQLSAVAGPTTLDMAKPWHPGNPMFAFGVLAALTFGLMAFSATARIGKTRISGSVGQT